MADSTAVLNARPTLPGKSIVAKALQDLDRIKVWINRVHGTGIANGKTLRAISGRPARGDRLALLESIQLDTLILRDEEKETGYVN